MDTSNKYITMCRNAEEIQKLSIGLGDTTIKPIVIDNGNWFCVDRLHVVWLPRQDQLQDMLIECFVDPYPRKLVLCLWEWVAKTSPEYDDSMEKLWISYVMYEKYGKYWNDSEWEIKTND